MRENTSMYVELARRGHGDEMMGAGGGVLEFLVVALDALRRDEELGMCVVSGSCLFYRWCLFCSLILRVEGDCVHGKVC